MTRPPSVTELRRRYRQACARAKRPPLGEKQRAFKAVKARLLELMLAENARAATGQGRGM